MALAVVAGGLFLAVLSTTVVSVALPKIGGDLHASSTDLQWIVDAYALVYASVLVAGGVLGDRLGRKGVFVVGIALFGAGSLLSGLASSVALLLAARALQGLGPALVVPGSLAIIRATFEDERQRATAIGLWSTSSGVALAIGPALGGAIVQTLSWRWVFLINVPLAAALLVLALCAVPRIPRSPSGTRFDWLGAIVTTIALAALAFAIIEGQQLGWSSASIISAFAGSLVAFVALVAWERTRQEPLIDVSLFRRSQFAAANVAALIVFFAFVGAIVYLSAYFQQVQARSPVQAGLDVSAIGLAFAVAAALSGRLVGRIGPGVPMITGLLLAGVATLGLLRLAVATAIGAIWWDLALLGAGIGLCLTPMTSIAVAAVGPSRAGMASAIHNALRQLGQVLGVAVLGALVYAQLPSAGAAGRRLTAVQGVDFVDGLHDAIWVSGLALFAAALLAALVVAAISRPTDAAGDANGRRPRPRRARTLAARATRILTIDLRRSPMTTLQATENKAIFTRFIDAMNSHDDEVISSTIDELFEPDALINTPLPIEATGAEKQKQVFRRLHRAFPDLHVTVEDLIAEADKVVGRNTVTGTHHGEYMGLKPTGKPVTYQEIFIFRLTDGRIAETWGVVDVLSQLKQLGAIPDRSA
jgi:MFS transporter, DHA2 family, methylenomycin A resistance protein